MEQQEYDELQCELASRHDVLPEHTLRDMERLYHLAASVDCSVSEFQEFDEKSYLFFALLLREVKRLREQEDSN